MAALAVVVTLDPEGQLPLQGLGRDRHVSIVIRLQQVALLIKTFPPQGDSAEWHWLKLRAAEDPRIHLVVASLERDELLALYGCCDVFLSLYRSEGFGHGMAAALQLGEQDLPLALR